MTPEILELGLVEFEEAELLQRELSLKRRQGEIPDTLLLLEHPPVVTMGRRDSNEDLRVPEGVLEREGIRLVRTDRGGRLTYHGPGQLIGYFIFALGDTTIPHFVSQIEELLIRTLHHFDIRGERDPVYPGVWVDRKKIAALGLHFEKGISRHGFALNVSLDLKPYTFIHPCGIRDRGVTSLSDRLKRPVQIDEVKERMISEIDSVFRPDHVPIRPGSGGSAATIYT